MALEKVKAVFGFFKAPSILPSLLGIGLMMGCFYSSVLALAPAAPSDLATSTPTLLIRSVPLDISGYSQSKDLDSHLKTAADTSALLVDGTPLLVHMEAIRRAYVQFGSDPAETQKFLVTLKARYMGEPENAIKFFDYGYAQLVMSNDKNGLFFLRKANDKLKSPNTALAYGLAQIDVDKNQEGAQVGVLTTRKMDAMYKLKDALTLNRKEHVAGIWGSYVRIVQAVKDYGAYDSFRSEDASTLYLPFGVTPLAAADGANGSQLMSLEATGGLGQPLSADDNWMDTTCHFSAGPINWKQLAYSQKVDINHDGKAESIDFFKTDPKGPYLVKVLDDKGTVIGEFKSPKGPYIMEDLEGDKTYEIVVRQYDLTPEDPVHLYRWNGKCIQEDKRATSYFK